MSLTLDKLRVVTTPPLEAGSQTVRTLVGDSRPASLADLVEVLKQEGAEIIEAGRDSDGYLCLLPESNLHDGQRWLILPLGDTT